MNNRLEIQEMQLQLSSMTEAQAQEFGTALAQQLASALPPNFSSRNIESLQVKTRLNRAQQQEPFAAIPQIVQQILRELKFSE